MSISPTSLVACLAERCRERPGQVAWYFGQQRLTYGQLNGASASVSRIFSTMGLRSGDAVLVLLDNCLEFAVLLVAAARSGVVLAPVSPSLPAPALEVALRAAGATAIVGWHAALAEFLHSAPGVVLPGRCLSVGRKLSECHLFPDLDSAFAASEVWTAVDPQADFILTMTSGSTGNPKPIVLSHRTKLERSLSAQRMYNLDEHSVVLAATPMYHSLAQRMVLLPLILGGTGVILRHFQAKAWVDAVSQHRVTFTIAVSSQLKMLLPLFVERRSELTSLATLVSSSALLPTAIKRELVTVLGCQLDECYGTSEMGIISNITSDAPPEKFASVGTPVPGGEIRIVDDADQPLPIGEVGEIVARSPTAFSRYHGNAEATAVAMRGGFFHTGDLGRLDADGFLYYMGRKKELIITGGINVYPSDVEAVILRHPGIHECAVIGVEDKRFGQAVLAICVAKPGTSVTERDLHRYCHQRLADFQRPLGYRFTDALPRNAMGKVMKKELLARYDNEHLSATINEIYRQQDGQGDK